MLTVYGNSQTCPACIELKIFLDENGHVYKYNDLSTEETKKRIGYKRDLKQMGIKYIPVAITPSGTILQGLEDIKKYFI